MAVPYSSQAGGFFTKYARDPQSIPESNQYHTPKNIQLAQFLAVYAKQHHVQVSSVVLAYLMNQSFPVVPIIGCRNIEQLEESLQSLSCNLEPSIIKNINAIIGS
jgi:aryl-alcohol dehydrogenase-like predicted oxidoreductase